MSWGERNCPEGDVLHALLRGVLFKTFTVRKNEFNGLLLLMFT